jgi:hypothetical protein
MEGTSPSQDAQVHRTVPQSAGQGEHRRDALLGPAAGARVAAKLLFEIGASERLARSAAEMLLPLLEKASVRDTRHLFSFLLEVVRFVLVYLVYFFFGV